MNRRRFLEAAAVAPTVVSAAGAAARKGRLKQSVSRWCFNKWTLEELARYSSEVGLKGIDLVGPQDWPMVKKYGLVSTMGTVSGNRGDSLNRKETHASIERTMRQGIEQCAAAGVPNIIIMSGNRRGMSDEEGLENCVAGLNRIKAIAEDKGVTVCLELLNSKVDHKDYQCDRTAWAVEAIRRVGSPRVKVLYDIYHMQIMEGDVIRTIRENIAHIGHFHTGGVPGRNEIDETQELNYAAIARAIVDLGFTGYFAHEFIPKRDPFESLRQAVDICDV